MLQRLPLILFLLLLTVPFRGRACDLPVSIEGDSIICDSFRYATYFTGIADQKVSYYWTVEGGTIISGNGRPYVNVRWDTTGTGAKISLQVKDSTGCISEKALNIAIDPGPGDAQWFVKTRPDGEVEFWAVDSVHSRYEWTFGDGRSDASGHRVKHFYRADGQYSVRLRVRGASGCWTSRETKILVASPSFIAEDPTNPMGVHLYPNPFRQTLRLSYTLTAASEVRLRIFDMAGKEMLHMPLGGNPAGTYSYELDTDIYNLTPGIYVILLQAGQMEFVQRMVRMP